jgi:hypothetical protein
MLAIWFVTLMLIDRDISCRVVVVVGGGGGGGIAKTGTVLSSVISLQYAEFHLKRIFEHYD